MAAGQVWEPSPGNPQVPAVAREPARVTPKTYIGSEQLGGPSPTISWELHHLQLLGWGREAAWAPLISPQGFATAPNPKAISSLNNMAAFERTHPPALHLALISTPRAKLPRDTEGTHSSCPVPRWPVGAQLSQLQDGHMPLVSHPHHAKRCRACSAWPRAEGAGRVADSSNSQ